MIYKVELYKNSRGSIPFEDWLEDQDPWDADKIIVRINRLKLGNLGHCEPVGNNISELKLDCGPGYRIYFSTIGLQVILILYAGIKRTQKKI